MTQAGTCHPSVKAIFDFLSACGVDVVALKRSIAFGLLRSRARAYCAIYDAVKTLEVTWMIASVLHPAPLCVPPCIRTKVIFGPITPAPAPVDRPEDTG